MSFEPFKFQFNPPKTVFSPSTEANVSGSSTVSSSVSGSNSVAGSLQAVISDLLDTSDYLQSVIRSRYSSTGVQFNPSADPDLAMALTRKYGSDNSANTISVAMYDRQLDAAITSTQLSIMLDSDSPVELNPIETSDTNLIISRVEQQLLDAGQYKYILPMLLRGLKSDSLVLYNWAQALNSYPAISAPPTIEGVEAPSPISSLDMGKSLSSYMTNHLGEMSSVYASTYQLLSSPNPIESGVSKVLSVMASQATNDIAKLVSILNLLKSFSHKVNLKALLTGMTTFVYARMSADAGSMVMHLDQLNQLGTSPLKSMSGILGSISGLIKSSSVKNKAGVLSGLPVGNNLTSWLVHNSSPKLDLGLGGALQSLGESFVWSVESVSAKSKLVNESFRQLANRRVLDRSSALNLLATMSSVDSIINLGKNLVSQNQSSVAYSSVSKSAVEISGDILSKFSSSSGSSFSIQADQVVINPPDMPPPPGSVSRVLKSGGLDLRNISDAA